MGAKGIEMSLIYSKVYSKIAGGVRATTAMHAGICFGFASFAHGGHRVRISCERQNYFFPFKILQLFKFLRWMS